MCSILVPSRSAECFFTNVKMSRLSTAIDDLMDPQLYQLRNKIVTTISSLLTEDLTRKFSKCATSLKSQSSFSKLMAVLDFS